MTERYFIDLDEENRDALRDGVSLGLGEGIGESWDALLKSPRILIMAEAGAGKTHECQRQQKRLWAAGGAAFYLNLNELAETGASDMLDPGERPRLKAWRAGEIAKAIFFLDSIDELRLTHRSLDAALRRLRQDIAAHLGRATVVLTSCQSASKRPPRSAPQSAPFGARESRPVAA